MKKDRSAGRGKAAQAALLNAMAGLFLLSAGAAGATAAIAAPCSADLECNRAMDARTLRDAHRAGLGTKRLAVAGIDHVSGDASADLSRTTLISSSAPLLYLTPRVASILEEVFDDGQTPGIIESPLSVEERVSDAKSDLPAHRQDDPEGSPLAGTSSTRGNTPDRYGPLSSALDDPEGSLLPKLQRQMYRTDI